jgi:DNA-binding Xre family transcriptional regulator
MANNDEDASSPTRKEKNSERENSVQPDSRNSSSSESSIALSDLASLILGSRSGENTRNRFSGNPLQDLLIQLSSDLAEGNGSAPLSSFGFHFVSNGGELEKIIKTLKDSNDSELRINSLSQLCEYLSMATEDTLLNFPLNDFLLVFIEILSEEESPEITLKAIRALCYVMEVSPSLISKIVSFSDGSVLKILGDKLLAISFIDVAEESITAFHKIANEGSFSEELLSCGCIQAMINFIDFFDSNLQIIIIEIVTSVCKGFPENHFNTLLEIMPALTQLLDSSNKIMAQKVSLCFFRLISQFNSDEEKLDVLFSAGCATTLLALLEQSLIFIKKLEYFLCAYLLFARLRRLFGWPLC